MLGHTYHVYILANRSRRIYVGVTRDLRLRVWQHKHGWLPGFTKRYGITALVYAELISDVRAAIAREKQLKRWPRWRKDRLIRAWNPAWADLSAAWDADRVGMQEAGATARYQPARSARAPHRGKASDPDTRPACGGAPAG